MFFVLLYALATATPPHIFLSVQQNYVMSCHYTIHIAHTLLTQLFTSNCLFSFHSTHIQNTVRRVNLQVVLPFLLFPPFPKVQKVLKGRLDYCCWTWNSSQSKAKAAKEENYIIHIHMLVQGEGEVDDEEIRLKTKYLFAPFPTLLSLAFKLVKFELSSHAL